MLSTVLAEEEASGPRFCFQRRGIGCTESRFVIQFPSSCCCIVCGVRNQVSCGNNHSTALTLDGKLFTWGRGKYGQLGLGDFASTRIPSLAKGLNGVFEKMVHLRMILDSRTVTCWKIMYKSSLSCNEMSLGNSTIMLS